MDHVHILGTVKQNVEHKNDTFAQNNGKILYPLDIYISVVSSRVFNGHNWQFNDLDNFISFQV